jgi:chromosome segregation ATPase
LADSTRQLSAADDAQNGLKQQLADAQQSAAAAKKSDDSAALRRERDELSGRVTTLTGEVAQLRGDRERMQKLIADSGQKLRDSTADAARIKELETKAGALQNALALTQEQVSSLQGSLSEAQKAKPAYPDLSSKVSELEAQVGTLQAAVAAKPSAPAYPDLSAKVHELEAAVASADKNSAQATEAAERTRAELKQRETELAAATAQIAQLQSTAAAKPAAPAYPDLTSRVSELENQLAEARRVRGPAYPNLAGRVVELETALADTKRQLADSQAALKAAPAAVVVTPPAAPEPSDVQKQLAETEDKLATALRGYALLQKESEAAEAKAGKATEAVTNERNTLAAQVATLTAEVDQLKAGAQTSAGSAQAEIARLTESLAALQRSTAQNTSDLAATRAVLQQLQGANRTLADENYQLKTRLAGVTGSATPGSVTPVSVPTTVPAARLHLVAAGDSLSRISQRYYGNANRWPEIYNANRDKIGSDGVLHVGTELRIP